MTIASKTRNAGGDRTIANKSRSAGQDRTSVNNRNRSAGGEKTICNKSVKQKLIRSNVYIYIDHLMGKSNVY